MDLTRPIRYNEFDLNDVTSPGNDANLRGCQTERALWTPVAGVGYVEKRSQADGLDASDVTLGALRLTLSGTLFGSGHRELWDRLADLRVACSPTSAFAQSPGDRGYLPLEFEEPTVSEDWVDSGYYKLLEVRARPLSQPGLTFIRDAIGAHNTRGMGIPWAVEFECRDPRKYARDPWESDIRATSGSGTIVNRGNYPSPLNILLAVSAAKPAGTLAMTIGGTQMSITIPNSTVDQVIRYNGELKVLTVEANDVEVVRMDLLHFPTEKTHPLVPPIDSGFSWTCTFAPDVGSRFWFWEAWA